MAARWLTMNKKYYNKNHPETVEALFLLFLFIAIFLFVKCIQQKKNSRFSRPRIKSIAIMIV